MAALDDSLTKFEGKNWSIWADNVAISNLLSQPNTDSNGKSRHQTSTSFLRKEEMCTYGYCPVWEDFYLVVCDVCGLSVKPQALRHHIELRHGGMLSSSSSKWLSTTTASTSAATTTTPVHSTVKCSSGSSGCYNTGEQETTSVSSALHGAGSSSSSKRSRDKASRRSPTLALSSTLCGTAGSIGISSTLPSLVGHPQHPSHVPPADVSANTLLLSSRSLSPCLSALQPGEAATTTTSATASNSCNAYPLLEAALAHQPSTQHYQTSVVDQQQHSSASAVSLSVNNTMPYTSSSADTSLRISSLPAMSSSTSSRNTSRCSSSNSVSHQSSGSNSTIGNNLELGGLTNGVDYGEEMNCGSGSAVGGLLLDKNGSARLTLSPVLDFHSPSPCSLSKEDEDSLDSRLRALHSPHQTASSVVLAHHTPLHQHHQLADLSSENTSMNGALINPSPHYSGQPHSVGPMSVGSHSVGPPSVGLPSSSVVGSSNRTANHSITNGNVLSHSNSSNSSLPSVLPPSVLPHCLLLPSSSDALMNGGGSHGRSMTGAGHGGSSLMRASSTNSAEEEVNRISAMLQKEVEALTASQNLDLRPLESRVSSNAALSHDIVESQGVVIGRAHVSSSLNVSSNIGGISSGTNNNIPINISTSPLGGHHNSMNSMSSLHSSANMLSNTSRQIHDQTNSHINASNNIMNNSTSNSLNFSNNLNNNLNMNNNIDKNNLEADTLSSSHQFSVATLNQIQADLLETVSESDLNAVLNTEPSEPVSNNTPKVYLPNNTSVQFSDSSRLNTDGFDSALVNSGCSSYSKHHNLAPHQHLYRNDQMNLSSMEHNDSVGGPTSGNTGLTHSMTASVSNLQFDPSNAVTCNLLDASVDSMPLPDFEKMVAQSDELATAVNSITQNNNGSVSNSFDSQMSSYLQNSSQNCQLPHVVSSPAPSPSPSMSVGSVGLPSASPLSVSSMPSLGSIASGSNIVQDIPTLGQSVVTSQGITVVIGGTATSITLPQSPITSLGGSVATIKKNSSNSGLLTSRTVTQSPGGMTNVVQHSPLHGGGNHTPLHSMMSSQGSGELSNQATPPHTTPSPKKSSTKKKKGSEPRKVVPLKDREYNPEKHCGVLVAETGKPCTRSLTCKTHSLTLRRAVNSRSKKFDDLLLEHKANKTPKALEGGLTPVQGPSPRGVLNTSGSSTSNSSLTSGGLNATTAATTAPGLGATSPMLVRSLTGSCGGTVPPGTPSPLSHHQQLHPMDPPFTPQHTPASPYHWQGAAAALPRPTLAHTDHFYVASTPQPLATCSYNSRRLGGYLATDHRTDVLRSALRSALNKPASSSSAVSYLLDSSFSQSSLASVGVASAASTLVGAGVAERLSNVKPLLARKLQATVPLTAASLASKDGITVGTGYNGHIQVAPNSLGIVGSVATSQLKRSLHHMQETTVIKNNTISLSKSNSCNNNINSNNVNKNKKVKLNESGPGGLNLLSNVVQIDASGNAKNHGIPVVAVSIQNGLSTQQTINLSNVTLSGMRTNSGNQQPIRIHPSAMKTLVRGDHQLTTVDGRTVLNSATAAAAVTPVTSTTAMGQPLDAAATNIVLNSGSTSYLIADGGGLKSFKTEGGGIRLELHGNTFATAADSRFIHATPLTKGVRGARQRGME